jgi:hypothetical protein
VGMEWWEWNGGNGMVGMDPIPLNLWYFLDYSVHGCAHACMPKESLVSH